MNCGPAKYGTVNVTRSHSNLQPRCDTIRPMTDPRDSLSTSSEVTSGTSDPLSNERIQELRKEINQLDNTIISAIKRRTEISHLIGQSRMGSGGTRLVHTREVAIINEFREELGTEGPTIASALLRMGRGRLG